MHLSTPSRSAGSTAGRSDPPAARRVAGGFAVPVRRIRAPSPRPSEGCPCASNGIWHLRLGEIRRWPEEHEIGQSWAAHLLKVEPCSFGEIDQRLQGHVIRIDDHFTYDEPSVGLEHSPQLAQRHLLIRNLTEYCDHVCPVEDVVGIREGLAIPERCSD